jgi:hypothetical protein
MIVNEEKLNGEKMVMITVMNKDWILGRILEK